MAGLCSCGFVVSGSHCQGSEGGTCWLHALGRMASLACLHFPNCNTSVNGPTFQLCVDSMRPWVKSTGTGHGRVPLLVRYVYPKGQRLWGQVCSCPQYSCQASRKRISRELGSIRLWGLISKNISPNGQVVPEIWQQGSIRLGVPKSVDFSPVRRLVTARGQGRPWACRAA